MAKKSPPENKVTRSPTTASRKPDDKAQQQQQPQTQAVSRSRRKARIYILAEQRPTTQSAAMKPQASATDRDLRTKPAMTKTTRARTSPSKASGRPLSALDAAAKVLSSLAGKDADSGLTVAQLVERMASTNLWTSPSGKTPTATLYAAMSREIAAKGSGSRFRKISPGHFALAASSPAVAEPAPNGGGNRPAASAKASVSSPKIKVDNGSHHARAERKARGGKA
jgi:hypothetical protein